MVKHFQRTQPRSRLKRLEEKKNKRLAIQFTLLTVGFLLLIIFVGFPLFIKAAGMIGDAKSSTSGIDTKDTMPPAAPHLMNQYEATSSAVIPFAGYAEPGAMVELYVNGTKAHEKITDADGSFLFDSVGLERGRNEIYAKAIDGAKNESQSSDTEVVIFDNEAPELEVTSPEDGKTYYEEEREILVAGKTEVDNTVKVNGFISTVDTEGNFVKRLQLSEGENEIKIEAFDEAGNRTEEVRKVTYSR